MNIISVTRTALDPNTVIVIDDAGVEYFMSIEHELIVAFLEAGGVIADASLPEPVPYMIGADVPWERMNDNEAEAVQDAIDGSPIKTRNMINKATSFTQDTDAFNKFKAIIVATLDQARADQIMDRLSSEELAAQVL